MKMHLSKKKSIISCIIIILIISSFLPIVTGNKNSHLTNNVPVDKQQIYQYILERNNTCFGPQKDYKIEIKNQNIETIKPETIVEKNQQTPASPDAPWPMYCHDVKNTGRSPYSTIDNIGVEKWRFDTEDEVTSCPVIDEQGVIYIAADYFYAVYTNGTIKWKFDPLIWTIMAPAIDENGVIYFGSIYFNTYLHAVYTNNGTMKWRYKIGNSQSSPTIGDDGTIYVGETDWWNLIALNPNGTTKWGFHANEKVYSSPAIGPDNTIYFGSWDQHLYALYPNNGTFKWKYNTGGGIGTSPCIDDNGIIYIVSATNGYLNAIYPNGTLKWRTYINGGTSPTVGSDGTLYCGWTNLYAINPEDGTIRWTFNPGTDSRIEWATPCTSAEGTIYFGTHIGELDGGEIIAVNPDGTEKWRIMIATDWVMSAPAIGEDGTVYAGSFNDGYHPGSWGYLHAIGPLDPDAPYAPNINGTKNGKPETPYSYYFKSTSPLNKDVYYYIDWGDNTINDWFGPYPSNQEVRAIHTYNNKGTYTIQARAKDTDNLWGPWGTLDVTMPLNQLSSQSSVNFQSQSSVLLLFLQQLMNTT